MTIGKAGLVGLGAMGAPMAGHLAAAGLLAAVGNRSAAKAQAAATEWKVTAAGQATDFADCAVVILCVSEDADVLENVAQLAPVLRAGSVVVDHSTVSVATAHRAAERLAAHGIGFLDAPVSGGVEGARNGRLSIMCGGHDADLATAAPFLQCYAARIAHMGTHGSGQATKAVNQIMVAGINEAVCEGLAFAEQLGLDADKLLPTLMAGAASNWFLDKRGASMLRDAFQPGFKSAHMAKDLRIVREMAQQAHLHHPLIDLALADYSELERRGDGQLDTSALIRLKRPG